MGAGVTRHPLTLLAGLPRSGTTWVAKILDSHPHTLYRHEPDRRNGLQGMPYAPDVSQAEAFRPVVEAFLRGLLETRDPYIIGPRPHFPKDYRSALAAKLYLLNIFAAQLTSAARLTCPIFPMANYEAVPDLRIVWKSVGALPRVGVFVRVLERPRAILLLRHPCGHVASMLRGQTLHKFAYPPSEDYKMFEILLQAAPARRRHLTVAHLASLHPDERLAWKWVLLYEKAFEDVRGLDGCVSLRYEDFCVDPEGQARRMLDFCGLSWTSATAGFLKESVATENTQYYSLHKNPLRAATRWQSTLSDEEIERIYRVVRESDLERLYPPDEKLEPQVKLRPPVEESVRPGGA